MSLHIWCFSKSCTRTFRRQMKNINLYLVVKQKLFWFFNSGSKIILFWVESSSELFWSNFVRLLSVRLLVNFFNFAFSCRGVGAVSSPGFQSLIAIAVALQPWTSNFILTLFFLWTLFTQGLKWAPGTWNELTMWMIKH